MDVAIAVYQARRERILAQLGETGVAVVFAAPERVRSNDTEYPYRPDSYLHYLTGFPEPGAMLLLDGRTRSSTLFCRNKDELHEIWNGFRYGPAAAKEVFGVDAASSMDDWQSSFQAALPGHTQLYALWGRYPQHDTEIMAIWHEVRNMAAYRAAHGSTIAPTGLIDFSAILDGMRLVKDASEQALMRAAAEISAQAHIRAMQTTRVGQFEYQVEGEILHAFMQRGARSPSYNSIVAGGKNACCLHYVANGSALRDGDLLLIDAGAEYQMYAGDITRTFPVNGRFSAAQKAVYDVVLAVNEQSIAAIRPGADWQLISQAAVRLLTEGLVDLGLLHGRVDDNIETQTYRRFYMHGLGHWLGLDVHDVGGRFDAQGQAIMLAPGMVTTVEPGLYIAAAADIPTDFHNIGIRIEDNVLVTPTGHEVLTRSVPKSTAEIEALMLAR